MSRILVVQHSDLCSPGRLGRVLGSRGHILEIVRPDRGGAAALPADLREISGVISLGGPQNVTDGLAWMPAERSLLAEAHKAGLPVVGICLGHQMIAAALGGEVRAMGRPEVGFHPVDLAGPGRDDPVFGGVPWSSMQFCSHGQEVAKAPPGAAVLASSQACSVQAYRVGQRTYGFQYHFEWTREMIQATSEHEGSLLSCCGLRVTDIDEQCATHYARFAEVSERLCSSLAMLVFAG
ncbi:MAG: type 1 glutamine amidotransferase [Phycisphaerales bacterium]|nr:type 1 glutamine amidotransferase [Phycisphaerales bacterium]